MATIKLSSQKLEINPIKVQDDFLMSPVRYPAFVAGWGTGKTMFGIMRGLICSDEIKDNLGLIVRKEFTDLRDSTIKDFEKYTGLTLDTHKEVKLPRINSTIMFRHGAELDALKNINLGWFMMEQAEEFDTDEQFQFLRGRLRRSSVPFHTGFVIANTAGHNWIWRLWKQQQLEDYALFEATTFDNQRNLPADFLTDLRRMEIESPHHYARYVLNSWEDFEDFDTLIPYHVIHSCLNLSYVPDGGLVLSCDPARYGDCETVITILQRCQQTKYKQIFVKGYRNLDLMQTAGMILDFKKQYAPDFIVVDDVGLGVGISDRLSEQDVNVSRFVGGSKALDIGFHNRRTECYWKLKEALATQQIELIDNPIQNEQLATIKYRFKSNGKKFIESKEDARARGVKSPDYADALSMACSVMEISKEKPKLISPSEAFWARVDKDRQRFERARKGEYAEVELIEEGAATIGED